MLRRLPINRSQRDPGEAPSHPAPPSAQTQNRDDEGHADSGVLRRSPSASGTVYEHINRPQYTTLRDLVDFIVQDGKDSRKGTKLFQYFKDKKFTGDIKQSIELTIRDYNVCARQHSLSLRKILIYYLKYSQNLPEHSLLTTLVTT